MAQFSFASARGLLFEESQCTGACGARKRRKRDTDIAANDMRIA
ncbi:hypothetical protein BRPE64_CCDS06650 [Caballeronia insecticola]|uniref:Uncharacterized protein n=1 Tax=Caballeronia insecticola TaxID=758793 RepID=R4WQ29_9BURK|nr:hypothetical protein BRPE64_CCDS06650 [Caballeronia insecticola]